MATSRRHPVKVLTALALASAALAAPPPAPPRARVETIALREGAAPAVELGLSRAAETAVHRLASPPRVYVDVKGATLAPSVARALEGTGAITRVRLGQFDPQTVRVVVELAAATPVDVVPAGSTIRLVAGKGAAPSRPDPAPKRHAGAPTPAVPVARAESPAPVPAPQARALPPVPIDVPRLTIVRLDRPLAHPAQPDPASGESVAFVERIARRYAAEDWPGVVELYASDTQAVRHDVDSTTRAAVVDALRELGLTYSARKLLGPASSGEPPALRVARAELVLAAGGTAEAASLVAGLDRAAVDPVLVPKLQRVGVRLALARGDLEGAAAGIGTRANPELRAELAHAAIAVGRSASGQRSCRRALTAFRQALDADGGRTARTAAGAGLVRSALACADPEATTTGLGVLAESPHPLLRRAATTIAARQSDEQREMARTVRPGG